MSVSLRPHGLYGPWNSPGQNAGVGKPFPSPRDLLNSEFEPRSPALQADSLPAEPPGKPKNTGVGSLSLLQRIFLTQESNQGLLHCRRILYQLSYQLDTGFGQMTGLSRISGFKLQVGANSGPYQLEYYLHEGRDLSLLLPLYLRSWSMTGTRRCPEPNFVINDEYHIGWSSGLNRKMHVKCLVEHLTLSDWETNVAFYLHY